MISYADFINTELTGIYGASVLKSLSETIALYDIYDGKIDDNTINTLDYAPTKKQSNYIKKLIKETARFLFGKSPEVSLKSSETENAQTLLTHINQLLSANSFSEKLIKAAIDCFIGKQIAVRLNYTEKAEKLINITFYNSLAYVFETKDNDVDDLTKIIFFYATNNEVDKEIQKIHRLKYELLNGECYQEEGIYNGYGRCVEVISEQFKNGLNFIPAKVIVNEGTTGDLVGESDVAELVDLQKIYNRLTGDDIDALKFNMFPQTVATNADSYSLENLKIAPGALIDLQTDATTTDKEAKIEKLESSFSYDSRLENTLNRLKNEMHELLNVPNISPSELKGFMTSGKSMKALYWQLVTRCESKFTTWRPALVWLCKSLVKMSEIRGFAPCLIPKDLIIDVENIYPLIEDQLEEQALDIAKVTACVMSHKAFLQKWNKDFDNDLAEAELDQIWTEKQKFETSFSGNFTTFDNIDTSNVERSLDATTSNEISNGGD